MEEQEPPLYKILLLGDSTVGKTCFLLRYMDETFIDSHMATIGLDYRLKTMILGEQKIVKVQLWDTAGQERFKSLAMTYYRKAYGILLLFDITKRSSFFSCKHYLEEIRANSDKNCIIYLIGNKIDLESKRNITFDEANIFAKKENIKYVETSAIKNMRVEEVFTSLLKNIYEVKKGENKDNLFQNEGSNIGLRNTGNLIKDGRSQFTCC